MAHFRTEVHIPIKRDDMNFQDRQLTVWDNNQSKIEARKHVWQDEFDRIRNEFFTLQPADKSVTRVDRTDNLKTVFEDDGHGGFIFKVRFDVVEFSPEEIQVKVQDNKLTVYAKHEEKSPTSSISREYSRQVDIPSHVGQDQLQSTLSRDGILTIEGPVNQTFTKHKVLPITQTTTQVSRPLNAATPVKNPIITESDGTRKLKLEVDIGEFSREHVVVTNQDNKLVVHAENDEVKEGRKLHKEFNKEYELPSSVDQTQIVAYVGDQNKLIIEAPLKTTPRKTYSISQSQDVRRVVVTKESSVTITDNQNRPVVTINVHRR